MNKTYASRRFGRGGLALGLIIAIVSPTLTMAALPVLYRQPAYESPLRGEPDDLLLLAGDGFAADDQVVYEAVDAATDSRPPPLLVPDAPAAQSGIAEIVSRANLPHSLTVRLPKSMRSGQTYALWVRNAQREWSKAAFINDPRPFWITPAFVYASTALASLPRSIKVVGRNLQPPTGGVIRLRLSGPQTVILETRPASADRKALDHFVAQANLPASLLPGVYRIAVSNDGTHWVELATQTLEVRRDPPPVAEFAVSADAHGACRPGDENNDTTCVLRAIAAAQAAGGGTVTFGPGVWKLSGVGLTSPDGIIVPSGVNLRGAGRETTSIIRAADWPAAPPAATFTLLGRNRVEGIAFRDARVYGLTDPLTTYLKLGATRVAGATRGGGSGAIEEVVITKNLFDRPYFAIADGGAPIERLFVTYNEFGAYRGGLELAGNRLLPERFRVDDSVVAFNVFKPGSHLDVPNRQGSTASEIGASHRLDFSDNTADGAATEYLYSASDAHGWRAGFFWHMINNHEMLLISGNSASCTGDKVGDGEAIALDNNGNTFALNEAATVLDASADSVTVAGPLQRIQDGQPVPIENYYQGHWIALPQGPGLGQVRKVVSYRIDPSSGEIAFKISPAWDVTPIRGQSRVEIAREFWQTYIVANTVDQRQPRCRKSNRSNVKGGVITLWAQTADSAVTGNQQYDADGISFQQFYSVQEAGCRDCRRESGSLNFVEIRANRIEGEYQWDDGCSSSGIFGSLAAGPTRRSLAPPTLGYGLSISHNLIDRADGFRGGAIAFSPTWYQGPAPQRWPLVDNALIFKNRITGFDSPPAKHCHGAQPQARTAIELGGSSLVWRTVLYDNACPDARRKVGSPVQTVIRVCPTGAGASCECPT